MRLSAELRIFYLESDFVSIVRVLGLAVRLIGQLGFKDFGATLKHGFSTG